MNTIKVIGKVTKKVTKNVMLNSQNEIKIRVIFSQIDQSAYFDSLKGCVIGRVR